MQTKYFIFKLILLVLTIRGGLAQEAVESTAAIHELHQRTHIRFAANAPDRSHLSKINDGRRQLIGRQLGHGADDDSKRNCRLWIVEKFSASLSAEIGPIQTCFIMSIVAGTLYMEERMKRGLELPWSTVTKLVVISGGTAPDCPV